MPCYSPLKGYKSKHRNESGKRSLVFNSKDGFIDMPISVPCGQCIGCRLEYSRQWAMRCMHEASLHEDNSFITLTYDDKFLPPNGSLRKADFQKFMKRLRARNGGNIRFFHAGEYGRRNHRPHYHALLFGFDFSDKIHWTNRNEIPVWRSDFLEQVWPFGQTEIGSVTFESAAYVARYMVSKFKGDADDVEIHYAVPGEGGEIIGQMEPEYATMSRRPGIGKKWFDEYKEEVFLSDSIIVRGQEMKPPKYYDGQYELTNPQDWKAVKGARKRARNLQDETDERLEVRQTVARARINLRGMRNL